MNNTTKQKVALAKMYDTNAVEGWNMTQSNSLRPKTGRDHVQGRIHAPLVVIQYGDYECSFSRSAYNAVKAMQPYLGDRLCFIFRHYPGASARRRAEHAPQAAEAAGLQGKFWEMHSLLFENQNALADDDLARYSRELGINTPRLMREVFNGTHASRVQEDIQTGRANGLTGSAACFVNGWRCDGVLGLHTLLTEKSLLPAPRLHASEVALA